MSNTAVLINSTQGYKVINFGNGMNISKFLNITDVTEETVKNVKEFMLSIRDKEKIELTSILVDRWMYYQVNNDSVYVKHIPSGRMNVLYQIVLGGQDWDGIYELTLKGKDIKAQGYVIGDKKTLVIESNGNYDVATFGEKGEEPYTITKLDFETEEEFKNALLRTGLIDEEDLEIYYKPDNIIKPYLNRVLPNIILK
jgi:hypothetical protein